MTKAKPRNLFIIVEGPDCVGKTTLIHHLKNNYNDYTLHALHYSAVKQDTIEKTKDYSRKLYSEMFDVMVNAIQSEKSGVICDRSHLGELVWGPIFRHYEGDYVLDIEKKYHHIKDLWNNLILFTIVDDPARIIQRDKERGDNLSFSLDLETKKKELELFKEAHSKSTIKYKYIIDIETFNEKEVADIAVNYIDNIRHNKED